MLGFSSRLALVAGIGLAAAACQNDAYGPPTGVYQPAPAYNNNAYYAPPPRNAYSQPAPNYYQNQQGYNPYQQGQGRFTTVTVTNRGQNGYRDEVVQQQVACGSQYYDGFRNRTAPRC